MWRRACVAGGGDSAVSADEALLSGEIKRPKAASVDAIVGAMRVAAVVAFAIVAFIRSLCLQPPLEMEFSQAVGTC